jgi:hypothetical protein
MWKESLLMRRHTGSPESTLEADLGVTKEVCFHAVGSVGLSLSLGIHSLFRDLASALGPDLLILAYLDDIYILSPDELALEQTLAFFDERHPSIRLNQAKCKSLVLEEIHTKGLRMLGACVGARSGRVQFLQEKIDHEAATVPKLINLPHQHALLVLRVCVQRNLWHLQRSLKSDDRVHLWEKLDTTLREAVARIRGLPSHTDQLDAAVISLPIKMSGLVRGLGGYISGLRSGSAMKLCSTRLGYLGVEAAGSSPHQAKGEPSDKEGVNSARHDRFPNLQSVPGICFHHAAKG